MTKMFDQEELLRIILYIFHAKVRSDAFTVETYPFFETGCPHPTHPLIGLPTYYRQNHGVSNILLRLQAQRQ